MMRYSQSSVSCSSKRTSLAAMREYVSCRRMLLRSIATGSSSSVVITFGLRESGRPVTAHGHWRAISSSGRLGRWGGSTTFSIIWPTMPSASIMTGLRYLNARSNPSPTKSAISCTDDGARTMR